MFFSNYVVGVPFGQTGIAPYLFNTLLEYRSGRIGKQKASVIYQYSIRLVFFTLARISRRLSRIMAGLRPQMLTSAYGLPLGEPFRLTF